MVMIVMFMITMMMRLLRVMMLTAIMVVMFTCLPLEESAEMKIADPRLGNGGKLATCSIVGMRTFYPGMETERQRRDESNKQLHLFLDPLVSLVSILRASVSFTLDSA